MINNILDINILTISILNIRIKTRISMVDIGGEEIEMAREQFQNLTEPMYYILMSLINERCGVDIMADVDSISKRRVKVGPGTLYALLGKFEKENMIRETEVIGRKRSYIITEKGLEILREEYKRLLILVDDGKILLGGDVYDNRKY